MSKVSFQDLIKLFDEVVIPFHLIERDLPLPVKGHRNDNDAEHSWSLALMATALAPEVDSSLDVGKICQFAVIHDVVEIHAGDTPYWSDAKYKASKVQREADALATLEKRLPQFPHLIDLIKQYEQQSSNEAKFVKSLDKFLNVLVLYRDKGYYFKKHGISLEKLERDGAEHDRKAQVHPAAYAYYQELREAFRNHPEYFYQPK